MYKRQLLIVLFGSIPAMRPVFNGTALDMPAIIEILMLCAAAVILLISRTEMCIRDRFEQGKHPLWRAYHFERFGLDSEMWREMGFEWRERFRKVYVVEFGLCG